PKEASEKTVTTLSAFKQEIIKVFNIGIAGSLSTKMKVNDAVWVRSSYAQNTDRTEFKSYTAKFHQNIDCMTVNSRVTTIEEKKNLSCFADIIDRELWSIASACHLFKIDFLALKLISDDLDSTDICQLIKDEAPALSKKLLAEYKLYVESQKKITSINVNTKSDTLLDQILSHPKLYFTTSQTRKLTTLLRGHALKKILSDLEIKSLIQNLIESNEDKITSKEISKNLLLILAEKLNPLNTQIKKQIKDAVFPLTNVGAVIGFDPELEQEYIHLNFQIKNTKDQKKLILALEQFNYQKIKDIFAGNLDDDV
ncbi:MAG: hypothetical protein K2Q18_03280, partial [Bdellovibrionales bacterium]|nr:hypothetical protein [Bdellovibrionales bacterium]